MRKGSCWGCTLQSSWTRVSRRARRKQNWSSSTFLRRLSNCLLRKTVSFSLHQTQCGACIDKCMMTMVSFWLFSYGHLHSLNFPFCKGGQIAHSLVRESENIWWANQFDLFSFLGPGEILAFDHVCHLIAFWNMLQSTFKILLKVTKYEITGMSLRNTLHISPRFGCKTDWHLMIFECTTKKSVTRLCTTWSVNDSSVFLHISWVCLNSQPCLNFCSCCSVWFAMLCKLVGKYDCRFH